MRPDRHMFDRIDRQSTWTYSNKSKIVHKPLKMDDRNEYFQTIYSFNKKSIMNINKLNLFSTLSEHDGYLRESRSANIRSEGEQLTSFVQISLLGWAWCPDLTDLIRKKTGIVLWLNFGFISYQVYKHCAVLYSVLVLIHTQFDRSVGTALFTREVWTRSARLRDEFRKQGPCARVFDCIVLAVCTAVLPANLLCA